MSVVRREAQRRWSLVGAGVAVLCLLPVAVSARPDGRVDVDPAVLRELILGSAQRPYSGYVDTRGELRLPELPALGDMNRLLGSSTRMRAWRASPAAWRVAVLEPTGERDIYRSDDGVYLWDFERNLVAYAPDELSIRLPWAADLLPPDLARRLLSAAADEQVTALESRRVAGVMAAGLRLTPSDPDSTIGRIDVWADPSTGLPLQVEIAPLGATSAIFTSRFLELEQTTPDPAVVRPEYGSACLTGRDQRLSCTTTTVQAFSAALSEIVPASLPRTLAGRTSTTSPIITEVAGVGAYGEGLARFAVVALPGRVGFEALQAARQRGARPVTFPNGEGLEIGDRGTGSYGPSLINALIIRSEGDRGSRRSFLLAGPVAASVLRTAGAQLLAGSVDR